MTHPLAVNEIAVAWVEALQSRGVTLSVHGKAIAFDPKSAYGEMSADERQTLKAHKAAIVGVVRTGSPVLATATAAAEAAQPTLHPAPPCDYCHGPCVGHESEHFAVLHWTDPAEVQRRSDEATAVMLAALSWSRGGGTYR